MTEASVLINRLLNTDFWARESLKAKSKRLLDKLEGSMDSFLQAYCNASPSLPMASCRNE